MKSLKKYVMGLVAMTIAIGAVTLMSMSAGVEVEKEKVSAVFHYTDQADPGNFANPLNWSEGPSTQPCNTGATYPCEMIADNEQDLEDKLSGKNNAQVLSISDSTRD